MDRNHIKSQTIQETNNRQGYVETKTYTKPNKFKTSNKRTKNILTFTFVYLWYCGYFKALHLFSKTLEVTIIKHDI